jgi:hypothetical protein
MPKGTSWDKLVNADKSGKMDLMKITQSARDPKRLIGSLKVWGSMQKNRLKKKAKNRSMGY